MVTIAVIVPAHNEERVIQRTIEALFRSGMHTDDIYVVDDASTDRTSAFAEETGVHLLTLTENVGKSDALNSAIEKFELCKRYDYVAFLDADTEVRSDYFQVIREEAADNPDVSLLLGQVKSSRGGWISAARSCEYQLSHDIFKQGQSNWGVIFVAPGCTSIYRSDVLKKLRYGADTLAEDMDLTMQVQRMGGKIVFIQDAVVFTQDPATFKDYCKQITRWQRGGWQVLKKYRVLSFRRWPWQWQKLDIYLTTIMLLSLIFNRVTTTIPTAVFLSFQNLLYGFYFELGTAFLFALYAAICNRRFDVLYKFPLYYPITLVNQWVFVKSFVEVMMLNKTVLDWTRVRRY